MATLSQIGFDQSSATFRADHLHALEPLIRESQGNAFRFTTSGLIVEPVEAGGAILLTTDGHTFGAIYDPEARASRPLRLTIPDATFEAVTPPAPVRMVGQGEAYEIPLPEWAQPKLVYAWGLAVFVHPAMPIPGEDPDESPILSDIGAEKGNVHAGGYRLHPEPPTLDWRRIFNKGRAESAGSFSFNPAMLAQFGRIGTLYGGALKLVLGSLESPALLTSRDGTFVGAVMPTTDIGTADVPAWAL